MKIVYIISAYKLPDQLVRLVRVLNSDSTSFYIHVDKKTPKEIFERMKKPLKSIPNVHFLKRHLCNWGDFGHVRATLKGISKIFEEGSDFDYVVLLTGQDYPIKSNRQISDFLQKSEGKSFMSYAPLPFTGFGKNGGLDRINYWHFFCFSRYHFIFPHMNMLNNPKLNELLNIIMKKIKKQRKFPLNLKPYGGGAYWCLSRACIEHITEFVRENKDFVNFFKYVYIPDEVFFQTILVNSSLKRIIVNDDLRYVDWSNPAQRPEILSKKNYNQFFHTQNLFARKFDITKDEEVLDIIDNEILAIG